MSTRTLPHQFPREVRSKLLEFDAVDSKIRQYEYDPLPPDKKRIRLLRLSPGVLDNPQIDCEMFEAEFNENHQLIRVDTRHGTQRGKMTKDNAKNKPTNPDIIKYEALSWRWGDEDNSPYTIMIKKGGTNYEKRLYKRRVSETLGLALKYLRLPANDRVIWIDAICINQADRKERSYQVSMMSLVYTGAYQVCVWLGEDDDDSTRAIHFIRDEVSKLKNFDALCKDEKHAKKWRALLVLMQRPWFSRRWVVQEIALARGTTVYCGPDRIQWRELAIAVELFVEVETATHRLSELMKKDDKFALVPYWFEHISELGASLLVNATARIFRDYQRDERGALTETGLALSRRSLLSLEYLVTSLSIFDCGRPHDSVYALLAIARDVAPNPPSSIIEGGRDALIADIFSDQLEQKRYPLDYNKPYPDVCKEFIHFCIHRGAKLDSLQALDILCRPWAKDWRPQDQIPYSDEQSDSKDKGAKGNGNKRTKTYVKHKGPWIIKRKDSGSAHTAAQPEGAEPRGRDTEPDGDGPQGQKPPPGYEKDNRNMEEYFEDAGHSSQMHWFKPFIIDRPPRKEEEARNGGSKKRKRGIIKDQKENEHDATSNNELGLPSWVARITGAPFDIFLHPGMEMVKMGRKNADPLVGIPQDGHRNYSAGQSNGVDLKTLKFRKRRHLGHYSLYVKGFCFDKVMEVAQVSQGGAIPAAWLDMADWSKARRLGSFDEDPGDPPDAFWRTLVADRGRYDRNPPYYYARACKETIMKGGLRSNAVNTTDLIYNERNSIVAEFCRRVQAVIWNRALIRTEKGILGLVSEKVKKGDLVCIIYGCTVPVILRKGKWKEEEERRNEEKEDFVEIMQRLMANCRKGRERKAQYVEGKDEWIEARKKNWDEEKKRVWEKGTEEQRKELEKKEKKEWKCEVKKELADYREKHRQVDEIQETQEIGEVQEATGQNDYEDKMSEDSEEDSEDERDQQNNGAQNTAEGIEISKQKKANRRDPYRHYEFLGEAYIHGMMDGEAVREKFYKMKPSHMFELR